MGLLEAFAAQVAQALQRLRARERELDATTNALQAAAQQTALVTIAQALGETETEAGVLAVVADQRVQLLGANGSALCLQEPDGTRMRVLTTDSYSADLRHQLQHVPVGFPLPAVHTAATGTPFFHADRAETVAMFPGAEGIYLAADVQASAAVPLRAHGHLLGCLSLSFVRAHTWRGDEQDLLEAFAALTAQALDRLGAREAERTASAATARFSETLQRSLLTSPPEPDHLQIAVRYVPATADAQVGGDWYDAFVTGDGTTSLVIGDVAGHDQDAAAAMGQLRNLLRGIGHAMGDAPAAVLSALDRAVHDLDVPAMVTIVLAQVEQSPEHRAAGNRLLRWSNAGHPPPLLLESGGGVRFLETAPDLLIGIDPDATRDDHTVVLEPGSTVLLYTDGLIERRGVPLEAGLAWLAKTVSGLGDTTLDQLCDHLLTAVGDRVEDDVALLALRAHPEDQPRPASAGPPMDPLHSSTLHSDNHTCGEHHP